MADPAYTYDVQYDDGTSEAIKADGFRYVVETREGTTVARDALEFTVGDEVVAMVNSSRVFSTKRVRAAETATETVVADDSGAAGPEIVTLGQARRLPDETRLVPCHPDGVPRVGETVRKVEAGVVKMPVSRNREERFLVFRRPPGGEVAAEAPPGPDPSDPSSIAEAIREAIAGTSLRIEDDGSNGLARIVNRQNQRLAGR